MKTKIALSALFLAGLASASMAASLFPGGPRYDGTIKIVNLTGASCPPGQIGLVLSAVYRAKVKPVQLAEAMSISAPLAGALFIGAEGDGTFKGANQAYSGSFIIDAWRQNLSNGVVNLTFTPATILETTTDFTFRGSISNYTFKNCTATVRGNFSLR
jgi:hypothetical protein